MVIDELIAFGLIIGNGESPPIGLSQIHCHVALLAPFWHTYLPSADLILDHESQSLRTSLSMQCYLA